MFRWAWYPCWLSSCLVFVACNFQLCPSSSASVRIYCSIAELTKVGQCCTGRRRRRWWWTPLARECGIQVKVSSHRWSSVHQHLAPLIQFPPNAASVCRASGVNNTALSGRHHFQSGQFPTTSNDAFLKPGENFAVESWSTGLPWFHDDNDMTLFAQIK